MSVDARLQELGIMLPEVPVAGGNYVSAKIVGGLCFLAGVVSADRNGLITGAIGVDRSVEEGYAAARACGLSQLALLQNVLGSLNNVLQIVSATGFVQSAPGFPDSPKVLNGFSDLMVEIFGDAGKHVRAAVGVSALPRNALVEVQMIVEVR